MKTILHVIIASILAAAMASCSSWNRTVKGGAIGAAAGGAVGAAIGKATGSTTKGAILGAAVGGVAGATIGAYMDKQAKEMEEDLEGAKVERVGEGIQLTWDSGILFEFDQAELTLQAKENIAELADILNKYKDTNIIIEGHTDSFGTEEYNERLSKKRAYSVYQHLDDLNVDISRIDVQFWGESQPIADNDSEAGRAQNRRVEMGIIANEKLKKAAENGDIES